MHYSHLGGAVCFNDVVKVSWKSINIPEYLTQLANAATYNTLQIVSQGNRTHSPNSDLVHPEFVISNTHRRKNLGHRKNHRQLVCNIGTSWLSGPSFIGGIGVCSLPIMVLRRRRHTEMAHACYGLDSNYFHHY